MSTRAKSLADRVLESSERFAKALQGLPEDEWNVWLPEEDKTVPALAHHVAWALDVESTAFLSIAEGTQDTGWTKETLDAVNQEQALTHSEDSRAVAVNHLQQCSELAAGRVMQLSDANLDRRGKHMPGEPEHSVAEWVEICLIGHPLDHLPAIESLLDRNRRIVH